MKELASQSGPRGLMGVRSMKFIRRAALVDGLLAKKLKHANRLHGDRGGLVGRFMLRLQINLR